MSVRRQRAATADPIPAEEAVRILPALLAIHRRLALLGLVGLVCLVLAMGTVSYLFVELNQQQESLQALWDAVSAASRGM